MDQTLDRVKAPPSTTPPPADTLASDLLENQVQQENNDRDDTQGHEPLPGKSRTVPVETAQSRPHRLPSINASLRVSLTTSGSFSPRSAGSETQTSHHSISSDTSTDRVFPIRSVLRVESINRPPGPDGGYFPDSSNYRPSHGWEPGHDLKRADTALVGQTPALSRGQGSDMHRQSTPTSRFRAGSAGPGSNATIKLHLTSSDKDMDEPGVQGDDSMAADSAAAVDGCYGTFPPPPHPSAADVPHVTTRVTHAETEDGHSVITGHDGTLQRCEEEPIHTPGAVQGFGVMVVLREEPDGDFVVRYASENSEKMLGYSPQQLFRLKTFIDILTEEQQDNLLDHIDFIRDEDADPAINGPEVFSVSIRPPMRKSIKLWCAIHINSAHPDLVICEFELDDDHEHPLRPAGELTPDTPHDTLRANPTHEEMEQSTEILSKPLRILRSARKRRGEQGVMQVFDIMSQVQEQLASAPNLETFLKILVGIVKELTGFHRVMVYQFDSSFNGKVVTELVDPAQTRDLYHGLNFPASDIPRQARDLYKLNKVRLLYDRDLETARIVCRTKEDLETPLDMSHAYLRAMSPIHLKYLANMAVRSSMSISINAFSELWGLIACHSYGEHGMRVSFPIRKMCRLVGDTASRNIERLSYASRLQARKLINTRPSDSNPTGYIIASSDDLLKLFDADFGLLSIKDETKILGTIEESQEALAMLEYLRMRKFTSVVASQDIREDFPDLGYPPGFLVIAGLLYVPLSVGGSDFIVFFRRGQVKEVKWAGNPYEKIIRDGTAGYLEPRTSFKTWHEIVIGKCREWLEEQVETAAVLCLVYGKFIEVWRQKEAAIQSSKLTRLLLANSAHEVRTPLNAIINYLEIALEGALDQETRENLARSHSASKSLIYVINDLLDLTKTEEGQNLVKCEIFDLPACIKEATEPFENDAQRKGVSYEVFEHSGLPRFAYGDGRRVRQALSNITANAVAHTHEGFIKIEIFVSDVRDNQALVDFVVTDSGSGMTPKQLDALFRDLEQVSTEEYDDHNNPSDENQRPTPEVRTLGLGLAVVARTVRNMDGQLRLKSEEGQGSRFVIQLPFEVPDTSPDITGEAGEKSSGNSQLSNPVASATPPVTVEGEIVLVDRGSSTKTSTVTGHQSVDRASGSISRRSMESLGSGSHGSQMSDADRLIDALSTPLSLNDTEPPDPVERRSSARKSKQNIPKSSITASAGPVGPMIKKYSTSPKQPSDEIGIATVRDTKTPVRAVKIPDEYTEMPSRQRGSENSSIAFEVHADSSRASHTLHTSSESVTSSSAGEARSLQVLIAEDDPINFLLLRKRLEKTGHEVFHAVNGQDCATVYKARSHTFDVVLMDMQMPIVDGLTSTTLIRKCERSPEHIGHSYLAKMNGRIPIFAVSASLIEADKQKYVDAGFDGWILKPIDFKRLNVLLTGIQDSETRETCLYVPGHWEKGGWFHVLGKDSDCSDVITPTMEKADAIPEGKGEAATDPLPLEDDVKIPDAKMGAPATT